ncbi:hypothetical protein NVIRENTERO_02288 [Sodalis praecaptivus]|nr:hypothetical protein NVIRENTERO_02288 [Sodalis praecaptivus]
MAIDHRLAPLVWTQLTRGTPTPAGEFRELLRKITILSVPLSGDNHEKHRDNCFYCACWSVVNRMRRLIAHDDANLRTCTARQPAKCRELYLQQFNFLQLRLAVRALTIMR